MADDFKLDDESQSALEQVKKGKPRRFVLLIKGAKILSLVVYKKGSLANFKKQAKEQGTGELIHGVVGGKGQNIVFQLAAADGFTDEPTTPVKLKEFVNAASGENFKPKWELVAELTPVLDEDDPLVKRFLALQPRIAEASEKDAETANFFNDLCLEAGKALEAQDAQAAELKIAAIEAALNRAGTAPTSDEEKAYIAARDKLAPSLEECLSQGRGDVGKMRAVRDFAQGKAGNKEFAAAIKSLAMLEELVRAALGGDKKETDVIPEGTVSGIEVGNQLRTARLDATRGIADLVTVLERTGEKQAVEIAAVVKKLSDSFPTRLETLLDELDKADKAKDKATVEKLKAAGKKVAGEWAGYLQKHDLTIEGCEQNPWNIPVAIKQPIRTSLKNILATALA